ncbi:TonB-dependent receptor plug domain-containing protein [Pseudoxanthomonas sp. 10H]|uniref:TonB-dependent receptor plug domain-containing protein n=1 Tax=Pseudoxanthomonas sp. 10H TaxID=3242729 RepID=UPI0035564DEC
MNRNLLSDAVRYGLMAGLVGAVTAPAAFAQDAGQEQEASTLDRIEVTGSRIKRADIEGALPVTVISREDIEISGKVSVAELLQNSTFNSFGSTVPTSGSSAQSFSELSLRGLGGGRTLILIDGRRAPTSPQSGIGQDLNSIPLAAVERVEILTDGASAIYGADAMGGVVNIITRKDFDGAEISYGKGLSERGGDTEQGSAMFGASGERGSLLAGVSFSKRGITFINELPWVPPGASSYSNNYYDFALDANGNRAPTRNRGAVPGGCTNPGFYLNAAGTTCLYDFNRVAADSASIDQSGAFARGNYQINDDWNVYFNSSVTRVESFGRFAPTPEFIFITAASPNNTRGVDTLVKHRFAALGPRDNYDDTTVFDFNAGFNWQATDKIAVDFGARYNESSFNSNGRNYVHIPTATQLFESGAYDIFDPEGNDPDVLNEIRATTSRDGFYKQQEVYAQGTFDLFEMGGGTSVLALGTEYREDKYEDIYDAQSAAGNIGGSSGNSSFGSRELTSFYGEWIFPITTQFEIDLAARYDDYSDFGDSTSPKVSFRYQPLDNLTLRASYGEGFRAPPLTIINQLDAFSADSVVDRPTAIQLGVAPTTSIQINGLRVATPELQPEESSQWTAGVVWDATDWLNLSLDYYNIEIENQIRFYSAQTVINRENAGQFLPSHLFTTRDPGTDALIQVRAGYGNEGVINTDGFDFAARTQFDFGAWGDLKNMLQVSYINSYEVASNYTTTEYIGTSDYPEWRASLVNTWTKGDWAFSWTVNAMAGTEEYFTDLFETNYGYSCQETVDAGYAFKCDYNAYVTHDLQVTYTAPWNGRITLGALNVTNKDPRLDQNYTPYYNNLIYNAYGRQVYLRYTQNF